MGKKINLTEVAMQVSVSLIVLALMVGLVELQFITNTTGNFYIDHDNNASTPDILDPEATNSQLLVWGSVATLFLAGFVILVVGYLRAFKGGR